MAEMTLQEATSRKGFPKLLAYSKLMGPAWLAIALNIGGATVANAGMVASKTGFRYIWALLPEVFVIWIVCVLFQIVALRTGEGPIGAARKNFGPWAGIVVGLSVFIVNIVFHAIQYAIIGNVINTLVPAISPKIGSIIGFVFVLIVVFNPTKGEKAVKTIGNVLQILVWVLLGSFLVMLFFVKIPWGEFFKGFIPNLEGSAEEMVLLSGLMGAAIAINVPSLTAYGAKQSKWGTDRIGLTWFEISYTNFMLYAVQLIVMIPIAVLLLPQGILISGAGTMAKTFEPLAGRASTILLCIGLLGSLLSTMVSQCLVSGYVITDLFGWEVSMDSKKFKISELIVTLFGFSAPLLGWNAFAISSYGAGFNLTFFPITTILLLVIANKKSVMGEYKVSTKMNIAVIVAVLLSLLATGNYWRSVF